MFRNNYDTDVTTWSPSGRLYQVEYACQATTKGSCVVGLKSNDYVILAGIRRKPSKLASYREKLFKIDDHMGIAISGLITDARVISKFMRVECLNHKFVYDTPLESGRLVRQLSDKSQVLTQKSSKRPYGVGLLVGAYDKKTGAHLYFTLPSGHYFEVKAHAMGQRAQTAKTYLENTHESYEKEDLEDLILHSLKSLRGADQDGKLTSQNVSVSFVGKDKEFTILTEEQIKQYLTKIKQKPVKKDKDEQKEDKMIDEAA